MKILYIFCFIIISHLNLHAQFEPVPLRSEELPMRQHRLLLNLAQNIDLPTRFYKTGTSVFDTINWAYLVDSTWGKGISDSAKLEIFDSYWNMMNTTYDCFVQLPEYNWDSIIVAKRLEIISGVSRGRFAAIINDLMTYINDGHSHFFDATVNYGSLIYPGLPVFRGESGGFGACLTSYHDSCALVYNSPSGHPFGLQQGDIILGYNNISWSRLVKIILRNQLPNSVYLGSSPAATWHRYMQAAGENWYLFDTINILKRDGNVENLPTSLMKGVKYYQVFCTEQMPVPGLPFISYFDYYYAKTNITSGVIKGSNIGYVCLYDCSQGTEDSLLKAVEKLVIEKKVKGLIFDIRTNFGGSIWAYQKTFQFLNSGFVSWVGYGERRSPLNRLEMMNTGPTWWYDVADDDLRFSEFPIAVIAGPNAVSAGDFLPVLFHHDPFVKIFGKSTAGAYGSYKTFILSNSSYSASKQEVDFFESANPDYYLSHTEYPVDFKTWFRQDSVTKGTDNLVSEAMQWISQSNNGISGETDADRLVSVFPNPSGGDVGIHFHLQRQQIIHLSLFSQSGEKIMESTMMIGRGDQEFKLTMNGHPLQDGNYFLLLHGDEGFQARRKILILH